MLASCESTRESVADALVFGEAIAMGFVVINPVLSRNSALRPYFIYFKVSHVLLDYI